jgi:branched-chain amino acid aminotransferase
METAIDWDALTFSFRKTKAMYVARCGESGAWGKGRYAPFGDIKISPAAGVLNYGQGVFEGLKAQRTKDGEIVLFRPLENGKRLGAGAARLCMPEFPPERFVEVVKHVVRKNATFVPPYGKGSLYIRACLWGTGPILGVAPAPEYTFVVFTCPVGPYYKGGLTPIRIEVTADFHRSAPRGTGNVKTICNYAGTIYPAKLAKSKGYADCAYLDARTDTCLEEVGGANFFCLSKGTLFTPRTGSILPGITRQSVITIARELVGLEVREKDVTVDEAMQAEEVFCTGTAAVISPIGVLAYRGKETVFNDFKVGPVTARLYDLLTRIQLREEPDRFGWVVDV